MHPGPDGTGLIGPFVWRYNFLFAAIRTCERNHTTAEGGHPTGFPFHRDIPGMAGVNRFYAQARGLCYVITCLL
jgi:hypothetical protein